MLNYIDTTDYKDNKVICSRNQWFSHISKNHKIMSSNKAAVVNTVRNPDIVYTSNEYPERHVFFKSSADATYGEKFKTKVIVEYDSQNNGEIVTAFPVKDEKGGIKDVIYPEQD